MENKFLKKGVYFLATALPMMFLSPVIFNIGLKAKEIDNLYSILIVGILLIITTLFLFVSGLNNLLKYLFKDK